MFINPISVPQPPRRHWKRRKHARASEILTAAAQIAAEKGSDKLRMAEIAERAGVTKGTVYLYFVNKADVLRQLVTLSPATPPEVQAAE